MTLSRTSLRRQVQSAENHVIFLPLNLSSACVCVPILCLGLVTMDQLPQPLPKANFHPFLFLQIHGHAPVPFLSLHHHLSFNQISPIINTYALYLTLEVSLLSPLFPLVTALFL